MTAPAVVTPRVPEIVEAPSVNAFASRSVTLNARLTPTAPVKSFPAVFSVILEAAAPVARATVPAAPVFMARAALCVIAPPVVFPPAAACPRVETVAVPPLPVLIEPRNDAAPVPPVGLFTTICTALAPLFVVAIELPAFIVKP